MPISYLERMKALDEKLSEAFALASDDGDGAKQVQIVAEAVRTLGKIADEAASKRFKDDMVAEHTQSYARNKHA